MTIAGAVALVVEEEAIPEEVSGDLQEAAASGVLPGVVGTPEDHPGVDQKKRILLLRCCQSTHFVFYLLCYPY